MHHNTKALFELKLKLIIRMYKHVYKIKKKYITKFYTKIKIKLIGNICF